MFKKIIIFILSLASAGLFLSGEEPQPMLLLFSLLLFVIAFQKIFQKISRWINFPLAVKLVMIMIAVGLITEALAIWNNANLTAAEITEANRLYSSDPMTDIILGWGYYIPLALAWTYLLKKYRYQTKDVFIAMGIFGIFFEGQGIVFLSFNPVMWLYAVLVHGSYMTMAYVMVKQDRAITDSNAKEISALKRYFYGLLAGIATFIPFVIWQIIIT